MSEKLAATIKACRLCYEHAQEMRKEDDEAKRNVYSMGVSIYSYHAFSSLVLCRGLNHPGIDECIGCNHKEPRIARILEKEDAETAVGQ